MDERTLMILLRLLHVVGGLFWVGSAAVLAWFLFPAQRAFGADGGRLVAEVMARRRLGMWMGIATLATLLSGFSLYGRNAAATHGAWAASPAGRGYGVGALAALLAVVAGIALGAGPGRRIRRAVAAMERGGARPSALQAEELQRLQRHAGHLRQLAAVLLLVAAAAMATARYW